MNAMKLQSLVNFFIIFTLVFSGSYLLELLFPENMLKYFVLGFVIWVFLHLIEKANFFGQKKIPLWLGYSLIGIVILGTIVLL